MPKENSDSISYMIAVLLYRVLLDDHTFCIASDGFLDVVRGILSLVAPWQNSSVKVLQPTTSLRNKNPLLADTTRNTRCIRLCGFHWVSHNCVTASIAVNESLSSLKNGDSGDSLLRTFGYL